LAANKKMKNKNPEIKFKGGVIIIGSLLWDNSKIRKEWKNQNLNMDQKKIINVPIRYGRVSKSRNCTHSMIFSSECKSDDKMGKGYFIPFNNELSIKQILEQGKFMIDAEHNKTTKLYRFNWSWGCLGITINPNLSIDKSKDLKFKWSEKYTNGFNPRQYKIDKEESIISKEGLLKIKWANELKEIDFIIGTATKPNIDFYPNSREIAIKMIVNKYDEYFKNNRENSITTFQDSEIEVELTKTVE
tara:strand:+ start:873 stop:1607 length:735 start_codon:yes stop_codon:yes gene_type:complete